jgi:hypothetical protein
LGHPELLESILWNSFCRNLWPKNLIIAKFKFTSRYGIYGFKVPPRLRIYTVSLSAAST